MARGKRSNKKGGFVVGPCTTCGAIVPLDLTHDCQKVKRACEKAAAAASKAEAKHRATNHKLKKRKGPAAKRGIDRMTRSFVLLCFCFFHSHMTCTHDYY